MSGILLLFYFYDIAVVEITITTTELLLLVLICLLYFVYLTGHLNLMVFRMSRDRVWSNCSLMKTVAKSKSKKKKKNINISGWSKAEKTHCGVKPQGRNRQKHRAGSKALILTWECTVLKWLSKTQQWSWQYFAMAHIHHAVLIWHKLQITTGVQYSIQVRATSCDRQE